eukprot:11152943-Karenia_brevis.AAC.1
MPVGDGDDEADDEGVPQPATPPGTMDVDNPPEIEPGPPETESWPGEVMRPGPKPTASPKRATAAESKPKANAKPRGRPKTRVPPVPRGRGSPDAQFRDVAIGGGRRTKGKGKGI